MRKPGSLLLSLGIVSIACGPTVTRDNLGGHRDGGLDDGHGGGDDEFTPPPPCDQSVPIIVEREHMPPDVLLVVDRSGSMMAPLDVSTFTSKWEVMRAGIGQVVTARDEDINFGLSIFPGGGFDGDACAGPDLMVDIGPLHASAIKSALGGTSPTGDTPTDAAMDEALDVFRSIPQNPYGSFVILATDGVPNCVSSDPEESDTGPTLQAIAALHDNGINTYVLGFGGGGFFGAASVDTGALEDMADAGGTDTYFTASSPAELAVALNAISGLISVPSCTYDLTTEPSDITKVAVTFDGQGVPMNRTHASGWDYDPSTNTITFFGETCAELQSGSVQEVHVDYGCGGVIIG